MRRRGVEKKKKENDVRKMGDGKVRALKRRTRQ
jgi:hypothetical protein